MKKRKLTFKEKIGVFAAIIMFCGFGMMMGGNEVGSSQAGNIPVEYSGAGLFAFGAGIAIWLLVTAPEKDDEDFGE